MKVGDTFLLRYPIVDDKHLWIVAYDRDGSIIIFNFTTRWPNSDITCPVEVGEHPFVKYPSVISYQHGRLFPPAAVGALLSHGIEKRLDAVSPQLLGRIQEGALRSPFTPQKLKKLMREFISP